MGIHRFVIHVERSARCVAPIPNLCLHTSADSEGSMMLQWSTP